MPTYEYRCPDGHLFERIQKMTDRSRVKCPECGQLSLRQISGGAALVFKGSGFYITDYGKDGKGPRKGPPETTEPKTPDAKETKAAADKPASDKPSKAESGASKKDPA
jgi:putative FmdB family regulatory protein